MNLNPIIIQRKNLHKKLWEIVRPQNAHEGQVELGAYRRDFYEECGFNLPIELNTAPSLYRLCQSVKDKLNVQDDVWFQKYCNLYGITTEQFSNLTKFF